MNRPQDNRDAIHASHPVRRSNFTCDTAAADALYQELGKAVERRVKGMSFTTRPNMGLSTALRLSAEALAEAQPSLPVALITAARTRGNDAAFWRSVLGQIAPTHVTLADALVLQERLELNLAQRAQAHGEDRALVIIDRAHNCTDHQLILLSMLQDAVEQHGVRLIIVLAGNPTLLVRRDDLIRAGHSEPHRRFFDHERQYHGIRSADELSFALQDFDETTYPDGSNQTVTGFYYPDAFARGFRLAHQSAALWSVLYGMVYEYDEKANLTVEVEVEYVLQTVCETLEEAFLRGPSALPPDESIWRKHAAETAILSARKLALAQQGKGGKK